MSIIIMHNKRCGNSRKCLQIIQEHGVIPQVREYLKDPLTREELEVLLDQLGGSPTELIRTKETLFKEHYSALELTREAIIKVLLSHPELMQRPVVSEGEKAVIARPTEKVLAFLHDINHAH